MTSRSFWVQKRALLIYGFIILTFLISLAISKGEEKAFVVIIVLIIGAVLVVASILYERLPLYLLVVSLPVTEMLKVEFIPTTLLVIPGGLAIVALLAAVAFQKKPIFTRSPALVLSIVLGIWASVAMAIVGSATESRPYWLVIVLLWLVPNLLTKPQHLLRAAWLFLMPLGFLGMYVFVQRLILYLTARDISIEALHLSFLQTGDVNITGLWITLGIPFAYYLFGYYKNEPGKQVLLLVAGIAMLAGALATLSVGVSVGLCAIAMLILWFQQDIRTRVRGAALVAILLLLVFNELLAERVQSQQLLAPDSTWGNNRVEIWSAGLQAVRDHPLFGIGMEPARRVAILKYTRQWFIQDWYNQGLAIQPHNVFLSIGIETGLPGVVIYVLFLGSILFPMLRLRRKLIYSDDLLLKTLTNMGLVALIGGLTQSIAISSHLDKLIWFLMGFAVALLQIVHSEQKLMPSQEDTMVKQDSIRAVP